MAKLPWTPWHQATPPRDGREQGELPLRLFAAALYEVLRHPGEQLLHGHREDFVALTSPTGCRTCLPCTGSNGKWAGRRLPVVCEGARFQMVVVCVAFAVTNLLPAGAAQSTVTIGGVELPAECPLVRREHPRLLFTRADIPRLRARLKNPRLAAELAWAKRLAAQKKAGAILLGVLYHLTGERRYLEEAKVKLQPSWFQTYALAADLVMAGLTPAEQDAEADRLVAVLKKERWRPHVALALAAWGHGHDDYLAAHLKGWYESDLVRVIRYNNVWSQGRGGSSMAHGYYGEHFYTEPFTMAVAWTNATGQDWVTRCDFAAHTPEYYLFHYRPWVWPPQVVHLGVTAMCGHWQSVTPAKFQGENLAVLAATRFHDGLGQWWVDQVISRISRGWGTSALRQGAVWGKLLWYDPDLPEVAPEKLPPARLFPENGHVVMRSDWTPEATYALFRCGRFGEIDGLWGRNNADNLSFLIEKHGILAADTGGVHALNCKALGFAPGHGGLPAHVTEYARQTVAHNSLTVGHEPIEHHGWKHRLLGVVRRGGQSPIQDKSWWKLWKLPPPKPGPRPFKEGEITAYETSPLFDYAAGDATHSYPPTRVKSITRQFVYLRPDTFVVFDRVTTAHPGLETIWMLHSLYRPRWNGDTEPDASLPAARQFAQTPDGKGTRVNPHPGGRFVHTGGDTFIIDDESPKMTGRLFAKVLLPEEPHRLLRSLGGAWHEFEVDGINYGPTETTYGKYHGRKNGHNRENSIGVEGWRIELSAKRNPTSVNFLVVLHVADQQTRSMPPVRLVRENEQTGVRLTTGGKDYLLTFAATGPLGGHLRITEHGNELLNRALASTVHDHYAEWRTDPRYRFWMTHPEYRNFIGTPTL